MENMNTNKILELLADICIAEGALRAEDKCNKCQEHLDAICHHVNSIARSIDHYGMLHLAGIIVKRKYPDVFKDN